MATHTNTSNVNSRLTSDLSERVSPAEERKYKFIIQGYILEFLYPINTQNNDRLLSLIIIIIMHGKELSSQQNELTHAGTGLYTCMYT